MAAICRVYGGSNAKSIDSISLSLSSQVLNYDRALFVNHCSVFDDLLMINDKVYTIVYRSPSVVVYSRQIVVKRLKTHYLQYIYKYI